MDASCAGSVRVAAGAPIEASMKNAGKAIADFMARARPVPPIDLDICGDFRAAPEVGEWAFGTFIEEGSLLENPDHRHLIGAHIGWLWTNVPNGRHMRAIAGQCELGTPMAQGKWSKGKLEMLNRQWFGGEPDFVITLSAQHAETMSDVAFCALVEHELYHAGQEQDEFGAPKFRKSGKPAYAIRGHDVEEHVGVVRRYGATSEAMREMVEAIKRGPEIGASRVMQACGTCHLRRVA